MPIKAHKNRNVTAWAHINRWWNEMKVQRKKVERIEGKVLSYLRVLKRGNRNTKSLAYTSLAQCWDPCREGRINALDRVQTKAAQFTDRTKDSDWENLAQRRTAARLCALFKAYTGERARKAVRDRLRRPDYLRRVDRVREIRDRKQRTDIGKYSFVNRTIKDWTNYLQKR